MVLNNTLGGRVDTTTYQYLLNFARRTEIAYDEYARGQLALSAYVNDTKHSSSLYFATLHHFDTVLAQIRLARMPMRKMTRKDFYEPGDGSVLERICKLRDYSEHIESLLAEGKLSGGQTIAVWLTNEGMESIDVKVDYAEIAQELSGMARLLVKLERGWGDQQVT